MYSNSSPSNWLSSFACPECKTALQFHPSQKKRAEPSQPSGEPKQSDQTVDLEGRFECPKCQRFYPFEKGIAILMVQEAKTAQQLAESPPNLVSKIAVGTEVGIETEHPRRQKAIFTIRAGADAGHFVDLDLSHFRLVRRTPDPSKKSEQADQTDFLPFTSLSEPAQKVLQNFLASKDQTTRPFAKLSRAKDLILDDPGISRLHAILFHDERGVGVFDLASSHGTFVNGEEIERRILQNGDRLEFGITQLVLEETEQL